MFLPVPLQPRAVPRPPFKKIRSSPGRQRDVLLDAPAVTVVHEGMGKQFQTVVKLTKRCERTRDVSDAAGVSRTSFRSRSEGNGRRASLSDAVDANDPAWLGMAAFC